MKKVLLTAIAAVLATTTVAFAAPQFGLGAYASTGGSVNPGIYVTDDVWAGSLQIRTSDDDKASETNTTTYRVGVDYKVAMDSATAATIGLSYQAVSGTVSGVTITDNNSFGLVAGIERDLGNNLLLDVDVNVYTSAKNGAVTTTGLLNGGQVGIVYLF